MKTLVLALTCILCFSTVFSQTEEEMKAWQASMTPGEQHAWLATMDGQWHSDITMWMDPSQPPTKSKGETTNEMVLNGLYQRGTHTAEMMGMPFKGEGITGYDNLKKKFVSTWIDNMGSGVMIMEGDYDKDSNKLTLVGTMTDPMTGSPMNVKEVVTYTSKDSNTFEMYMVQDGKDIKTMEIVYTRVK